MSSELKKLIELYAYEREKLAQMWKFQPQSHELDTGRAQREAQMTEVISLADDLLKEVKKNIS